MSLPAWIWPPASGAGNTTPSAVYSPDVPPAVPSALDDEFTSPTLDPKWTVWDPGLYQTRTPDPATSQLVISGAGNGADRCGGIVQPAPGAEYAIYAKVRCQTPIGRWKKAQLIVGKDLIANPATDPFDAIQANIGDQGNDTDWRIVSYPWTNYTTQGVARNALPNQTANVMYLRVRVHNNTISVDACNDGVGWCQINGGLVLAYTPLYVGVSFSQLIVGVTGYMQIDFFRAFVGAGTSGFNATQIGGFI